MDSSPWYAATAAGSGAKGIQTRFLPHSACAQRGPERRGGHGAWRVWLCARPGGCRPWRGVRSSSVLAEMSAPFSSSTLAICAGGQIGERACTTSRHALYRAAVRCASSGRPHVCVPLNQSLVQRPVPLLVALVYVCTHPKRRLDLVPPRIGCSSQVGSQFDGVRACRGARHGVVSRQRTRCTPRKLQVWLERRAASTVVGKSMPCSQIYRLTDAPNSQRRSKQ